MISVIRGLKSIAVQELTHVVKEVESKDAEGKVIKGPDGKPVMKKLLYPKVVSENGAPKLDANGKEIPAIPTDEAIAKRMEEIAADLTVDQCIARICRIWQDLNQVDQQKQKTESAVAEARAVKKAEKEDEGEMSPEMMKTLTEEYRNHHQNSARIEPTANELPSLKLYEEKMKDQKKGKYTAHAIAKVRSALAESLKKKQPEMDIHVLVEHQKVVTTAEILTGQIDFALEAKFERKFKNFKGLEFPPSFNQIFCMDRAFRAKVQYLTTFEGKSIRDAYESALEDRDVWDKSNYPVEYVKKGNDGNGKNKKPDADKGNQGNQDNGSGHEKGGRRKSGGGRWSGNGYGGYGGWYSGWNYNSYQPYGYNQNSDRNGRNEGGSEEKKDSRHCISDKQFFPHESK